MNKIKYEDITILDFRAEWCIPCDHQSIILNDLYRRLKGRIEIRKIDIDDQTGISKKFNINAVPTLCLLKKGKEKRRFIGVQPVDTLMDAIDNCLKE